MNALENNADPEVISWLNDGGGDAGGDADLISINTKALKESKILQTNFQGIRYAAFVRNLSRWYVSSAIVVVVLYASSVLSLLNSTVSSPSNF